MYINYLEWCLSLKKNTAAIIINDITIIIIDSSA